MFFKESIKNMISEVVDKAIYKIIELKEQNEIDDLIEIVEHDLGDTAINQSEEYLYSDINRLIYTDALKTVLPRLQFSLNLDRDNACVLAGIHSVEMQVDIYFTFEFILSLSGSKSINVEARYLYEGDTNTKYLLRTISEEEFEGLEIEMKYDITSRQLFVRLSDSEFLVHYNSSLICDTVKHSINGAYESSIERI